MISIFIKQIFHKAGDCCKVASGDVFFDASKMLKLIRLQQKLTES